MSLVKLIYIKFIRNNFLLLAIVVLGFGSRVVLLNQYPIGITHDELNYIISAKSLFWTGNFAPGTAPAILPTNMKQFTVTVAEVPALLLKSVVGPLKISLFNSRVLGAILSSSIILAIYFLTKHFTNNKYCALFAAFITAINPWSFLMGRTIFEVNFFDAFFLWGLLVLIKNRGWKIFYAFPLYLLGFFSYTGGQLVFYLFIISSLIYHFYISANSKIQKKPYIVFLILATLILTGYIFIISHNQSFAARGGEIYTPSNQEISKIVDYERKTATQTPFNNLFINKYIVFFNHFLDKYINAFSVNTLFLKGELRAAFSYQEHGTFYLLDLLFIILGASFLFSSNKKGFLFVLTILAVAPITSGLSTVEYSYSQRAGLMFPFLIILSGAGIGYLTTLHKFRIVKILLVTIIIFYLLMFVNLLHLYFFRFPIYASDGWFYQDRILSRYIQLTREKYPTTKIIVSTFEPKIVFQEYLFFTGVYSNHNVAIINNLMSDQNYSYLNTTFTNSCSENIDEDAIWIVDTQTNCTQMPVNPDKLRITRFRDVYENYLIKQDRICRNFSLSSYVPLSAFQNLEVEKQPVGEFCKNWITKL